MMNIRSFMPDPFFSVREEVRYVQEESSDPFAGDC